MIIRTVKEQVSSGNGGDVQTSFSGRVAAIVLDDRNTELFNKVGGWSGIGTVFYDDVENPIVTDTDIIKNLPTARPLNPSIKNYPLVNEIITLHLAPSLDIQSDSRTSQTEYYTTPVRIWNTNHHNGLPDISKKVGELPQPDPQEVETGVVVRNTSEQQKEIQLGDTFVESGKINPLKVQEGDIQVEGRFGNSINLTSNTEDQSPRTYIKTGQDPNTTLDQWIPLKESYNDLNIIVQSTSGSLEDINPPYSGKGLTNTSRKTLNQYSGPQTGIISNRVGVVGKEDVVVNGEELVDISSNNKTYVEAKNEVVVNSKTIKLGSKDSSESVILGDKFLTDIKSFAGNVEEVMNGLATLVGNLGVPITTPVIEPLLRTAADARNISNNIERYKSKKTKTE